MLMLLLHPLTLCASFAYIRIPGLLVVTLERREISIILIWKIK
jgi:hypothetical protein